MGEASEETRMEVTCPALAPGLRAKPGAAPTLLLLPRASDCVSGTLGPRAEFIWGTKDHGAKLQRPLCKTSKRF